MLAKKHYRKGLIKMTTNITEVATSDDLRD